MTTKDRIASVIHGSRPYCYEDWETEGCLCHDQADKVLDELRKDLDVASDIAQLRDWWEGVQE